MEQLPIACERSTLTPTDTKRQRELWSALMSEILERRELEDGYSLKLPADRLADAAALMDIERRCCGFLRLRLDADASEPHVWLTLTGPKGTKRVLAAELGRMLSSQPNSR